MNGPRTVMGVRAIKVRPGYHVEMPEHLATEEPMEIRVAGPGQDARPLAVTMRTPGHDFELAAGFVVTEAVAASHEIEAVAYCDLPPGADSSADSSAGGSDGESSRFNIVTVRLGRSWSPELPDRRFAVTSSCGICGKASIDQVEISCPMVAGADPLPASVIPLLPSRLRTTQRIFDRTGGLHAAGLFDPAGRAWCVREDVGRHNAVDKVVGHTVLHWRSPGRANLAGWVLMVSGRISFEIVQKAAVAGIGTIAAVSAPSSLAVEAADRLGVAVVAFVRGESFNVYTHPERIDLDL